MASTINTPSNVTIDKTKHDITVLCNKPGYQTATYIDHSGIDTWVFGNIIIGGLVGWGIDSALGADNRYDSPVNLTLAPLEAPLGQAPLSPPPAPWTGL